MNRLAFKILLIVSILSSCSEPDMKSVDKVDIKKFMGKWYELASLPTTFNKGCVCSMVDMEYDDESGYVKVINSCMKKGKQGAVLAKAFIKDNSGNARWKMQMFWPFKSDYYILKLADDYSYALVGSPDYSQLQILSRNPELPDRVMDELILYSESLGFESGIIKKSDQNCN